MGIIYKYRNKLNGKEYIGQTIRPDQRKRSHLHSAFNLHSDYYFHRALRKYGIENFEYEVLEETNDLNFRETFYIKERNTHWPNGYNQLIEHNGCTDDMRRKISVTKKRQWSELSEEDRNQKLLDFNSSKFGRKQSQSQKRKVMEANQKDWIVTNPFGISWKITNLHQFCRENQLDQGNMTNVAKGKLKHYKKWKCQKV